MNEYASVHEAFRPTVLHDLYINYGIPSFAVVLDDGIYPQLSGITYCHHTEDIQKEFSSYCKNYKIKRVCNFIDYLTPWQEVNYDGEVIYFVRSLYKANIKNLKNDLLKREVNRINSADKIITDSPTSQKAIKHYYNLDSELCWEYINPKKYLDIPINNNINEYYIIGRFDIEKRFDLITDKQDIKITAIGKKELGEKKYLNIEHHNAMPFEKYIEYIKTASFGLFPSKWESNGYSCQECLAMGKIPIVQLNSGGNERLCNSLNSFIIDYDTQDWSELPKNNLSQMQQAAKETITIEMYKKSLEKFVNVML